MTIHRQHGEILLLMFHCFMSSSLVPNFILYINTSIVHNIYNIGIQEGKNEKEEEEAEETLTIIESSVILVTKRKLLVLPYYYYYKVLDTLI